MKKAKQVRFVYYHLLKENFPPSSLLDQNNVHT